MRAGADFSMIFLFPFLPCCGIKRKSPGQNRGRKPAPLYRKTTPSGRPQHDILSHRTALVGLWSGWSARCDGTVSRTDLQLGSATQGAFFEVTVRVLRLSLLNQQKPFVENMTMA